MNRLLVLLLSFLSIHLSYSTATEDGYELWLRYEKITQPEVLESYRSHLKGLAIPGESGTMAIIRQELSTGLSGLLDLPMTNAEKAGDHYLVAGTPESSSLIKSLIPAKELEETGKEGYLIRNVTSGKNSFIVIAASQETGVLYGAFHFLRLLQTGQPITGLAISQRPKIDIRVLNHWDNLDRTVERGYAGFSIWDWHKLPDYIDVRYHDYARANASIGINGTVLTNVNANALVLTPAYLEKLKALADVFRPYGIKVYLTARFSAPIEIGGLETADPLNEQVIQWWNDKIKEIYSYVPDFGGFLVKANSEGQPGPQNYDRSHADGANLLARAVKPYGGIIMWRAFVYSDEEPVDRAKQAYNEFKPLDGTFEENVLVQVKNGAIDFQPREPFHPLFGAMPETPLMMEFQITQEYLGQGTQLVYLSPMFEECLDADTYAKGKGSTVAKVIDGSLHSYSITGIAGVSNIGTDRNWTGHLFGQSNWYAFGRLAWDPYLDSESIAEEWIRMTFSNEQKVISPVKEVMMASREAAVNYMTPLGLHHLMGAGHHYGPGPWVANMPRADWTSVYYHKADSFGIGFDRTSTGSNALEQYFPEVAKKYGSIETCPLEDLLWFHHVAWDHKLRTGRTLWNELAYRYQAGVDTVRWIRDLWASLEPAIDEERFNSVRMLLAIQEKEAIWWKDASLLYFQTFSKRPLPDFVDQPEKTLQEYQSMRFRYAPGIRPRW